MSFAKRFRETREGAGLTIAALVRAMAAFNPDSKIAHTVIHAWEGGVTQSPSADYLIKAARVLNVTPEWLLWGEDNPFANLDSSLPKLSYQISLLTQEHISQNGIIAIDDAPQVGAYAILMRVISNKTFAIMLGDESMQPMINKGDLLLFDKKMKPNPGDVVLAIHPETYRIIIGKYRSCSYESDLSFQVVPYNENWPAVALHETSEVKALAGVLVGLIARKQVCL